MFGKNIKIGIIGYFAPNKRAEAYSNNKILEVIEKYSNFNCHLVAVEEDDASYYYGDRLIAVIKLGKILTYRNALKTIYKHKIKALIIEYTADIADICLINLMGSVKIPIITVVNEIIENPTHRQLQAMRLVEQYSKFLIVSSIDEKTNLGCYFSIDDKRIVVVPGGDKSIVTKIKNLIKN